MPRKPQPRPDDPEESKRFIDVARDIDASEDPKDFDKAFNKVARPTPKEGAGSREKK